MLIPQAQKYGKKTNKALLFLYMTKCTSQSRNELKTNNDDQNDLPRIQNHYQDNMWNPK